MVGLLRDFHDAYRDSASPRCAKCGWLILHPSKGVRVMRRGPRAHLDNVMRCGLVWECPTCSAHIKAVRAKDAEAVRAWHLADRRKAAPPYTPDAVQWVEDTSVMLTLTVRHGLGDDLRLLRRAVARAFRTLNQSREWRAEKTRLQLRGTVRALEVTWGAEHGYHPHLHVAAFFLTPPPPELRARLFAQWRAAVVAVLGADYAPLELSGEGRDRHPVGVVVTRCDRANYLAKLGLEITAPQTKQAREGHYTPLDFLAEFTDTGDTDWLHRYQRYAAAMRGARQLTWSLGLKRAAGVVETTDEGIVAGEEQPGDVLVTTIATDTFTLVRRIPGAVASVLELAELYGKGAVDGFVRKIVNGLTARTRAQLRRRGLYDAPPEAPRAE